MRRLFIAAIVAFIGAGVLAIGGIGVALALEYQDSFCASCHTQPETTYYQRSVQTNSVDLAASHSSKNTRCIDCHSGSGPFGRAKGLQQGAHDLTTFLLGISHRPAITTNPLGDDSCVKCHDQIYVRGPGSGRAGLNHYHVYLPQWQEADPNAARCISCHPPHTTGIASLKFMPQGVVGQLCEDCHTALSGRIK